MKARVKATGEIIEIIKIEDNLFIDSHYYSYEPSDIEWEISDNDYWTRLEHQYAGMAMQGLMSYIQQVTPTEGRSYCDEIVCFSIAISHALVEKLKEKEEEK